MYVPAAKNTVLLFFIIAAPVIFLTSCTTVKNYPKNRPFVFDTNIQIEGKYSTDEKKRTGVQTVSAIARQYPGAQTTEVYFLAKPEKSTCI